MSEEINYKDEFGHTQLMWESFWGRTQQISEIIAQPETDPNLCDNTGRTALMIAIERKHTESIKELLKHPSIDITIKDNYNKTAWDLADKTLREEIPELSC